MRSRRELNCPDCNYDELTPFTLEEIMDQPVLVEQFKEVLSANTPVTGS